MPMDKRMICVILLMLASMYLHAQSRFMNEDWLWASGVGGSGVDEAWSIASGPDGAQYVTGFFTGQIDFGPHHLDAMSGTDGFVAKQSSSGEWLWAMGLNGNGNERGNAIAVDAMGIIYVTGSFEMELLLPGGMIIFSAGNSDAFILKLYPDGTTAWMVQVGGPGADVGTGIAFDPMGKAYATGHFENVANIMTLYGNDIVSSMGESDLYAMMIDPMGMIMWINTAGGSNDDISTGIVADQFGNSYVAGHFWGNPIFGLHTLVNTGWWDVFAAKLGSGGDWQWARQSVGVGSEWCNGIAIDSFSNIYIAGGIDLDASFGATTLTHLGVTWQDIFAAKLDSEGNWMWANSAGGTGSDWAYGIAVDSQQNAYLTGIFDSGSVTFGDTTLSVMGLADVFAAKLGITGDWIWASQAGGADYEWSHSICVDMLDKVYLAGNFLSTSAFGTTILNSNGDYDIFIAKLDNPSFPPGIPLSPQNLQVSMVNDHMLELTWDVVTQDSNGNPITPLYHIYFSEDPQGGFVTLGVITGNSFSHTYSVTPPKIFFYVTAELP